LRKAGETRFEGVRMENIRITLETLYDILRNEKKREDLQKLEDSFFNDVVNYLREKKKLLNSKQEENELFASGEKKKLEYELNSINRILKEIYERRETKIIAIALNKSKTGSDIIDTSSMLREEKQFYQQVLGILDDYRRGILLSLFRGELPVVERKIVEIEKKATKSFKFELSERQGMTKIKFIRPTPSFIWKDMKVYGPFGEGEQTEIFPEVAELLVRKSRAERV